jgi:hypothetical protein
MGSSSAAGLCWQCGEVQAGLEAAGRDGVGPVTDLDVEPVPAAGQHVVGAVVERLQRRHVAVSAYQDCRGSQQVSRQLVRLGFTQKLFFYFQRNLNSNKILS